MNSDSDNESSRPVTPLEEDCCHNACDPCIFDVHKKLLEDYKRRKKQNIKTKSSKNILCLSSYKSFIITNIRDVSENYILLSLKYHDEDELRNDVNVIIHPGQYVMLHSWNMTRSFTPICWTKRSLQFLIKIYPDGKFSSNLKNVKVGDEINVRGPYGDFTYKCNSFQQIIMFSMGSGIAAVYSVARDIIDNELEETKVHLIGAFQTMSQIPMKNELQNLSNYWNFKCTLCISQPLNNDLNLHGINIVPSRLNHQVASKVLQDQSVKSTLVLICGTHQFNASVEEWIRDLNYTHMYIFK